MPLSPTLSRARWLALVALLGVAAPAIAHAGAVVPPASVPGCTPQVLPRNDDDYSAPIPLGFALRFGARTFASVRISNNGYLIFGDVLPVWWQLLHWEAFNIPLIAAFHADVDTRPPGAQPVTYCAGQLGGRNALLINWIDVGHFDLGDDLLNSFQIILIDRSDTGPGNVDVSINYDRIAWDLSVPTAPAPRVGLFDGLAVLDQSEVPGSQAFGRLRDGDPDALIAHGSGSSPGSYRYALREGSAPPSPVVLGRVTDVAGNLINGATIQAAPVDFRDPAIGCPGQPSTSTTSNAGGNYRLIDFGPAPSSCLTWTVTVFPPAGSTLLPVSFPLVLFSDDQVLSGLDIVLREPTPLPTATTIAPSRGALGDPPRVYWRDRLTLSTPGCPLAIGVTPSAQYVVVAGAGAPVTDATFAACTTPVPGIDVVRCGAMFDQPGPVVGAVGTFIATIDPLAPAHGDVTIAMKVVCDPDFPCAPGSPGCPNPLPTAFDLYIDPSGQVRTTRGTPVAGATVTLLRSDYALGPFTVVRDGSAVMSPENRNNPDYTDDAGHFAWNTLAGFYVVRAEYPGCVAPGRPDQPFATTDVLPVPPPQLDLAIVLDCEAIEPPALTVPAAVHADATSRAGAVVTFAATAVDGRDGQVPVACAPPSGSAFPLGATTVTCSAADSSGNVANQAFPLTVTVAWSDVLPPLSPTATTCVPAGRPVPVAFALTGGSAPITDLVARLWVAPIVDGVVGPEAPARSAGDPRHGATFRYDRHRRRYELDWATTRLPRGDYQLRVELGDGERHTARVALRHGCGDHGDHDGDHDGDHRR